MTWNLHPPRSAKAFVALTFPNTVTALSACSDPLRLFQLFCLRASSWIYFETAVRRVQGLAPVDGQAKSISVGMEPGMQHIELSKIQRPHKLVSRPYRDRLVDDGLLLSPLFLVREIWFYQKVRARSFLFGDCTIGVVSSPSAKDWPWSLRTRYVSVKCSALGSWRSLPCRQGDAQLLFLIPCLCWEWCKLKRWLGYFGAFF